MLRVYLNGEICVTSDGRLVREDRLPGRQGRVVFAYLVSERARSVSRDELAEILWPRELPSASDVALSSIVSKLRGLFVELELGRDIVVTRSGGYQISLPPKSWIDMEAALESVHLAEAALQSSDPRAAYGPSVVASAILRRPFLPGEEGRWIDGRRQALRKNLLRALDCLAQIHSATGEMSLALRAAEEAVDLEPLREAGYRRLMLVHDAAGNRAEALRVYATLESMLQQELMTAPAPETRRVYEVVARRSEIG